MHHWLIFFIRVSASWLSVFSLRYLNHTGLFPFPSKARRHNSLTNDLGFMDFRRTIAPLAHSQCLEKTQGCGNFWCFVFCICISFTASPKRNACNENSAPEFSHPVIQYRYTYIKESRKNVYKFGIQQLLCFPDFHREEMGILYCLELQHALIGLCSGFLLQEKWRWPMFCEVYLWPSSRCKEYFSFIKSPNYVY